jgi:thymidylate synthase (FAD)
MSIDDLPQDVIDWFDNAQNQVINTCMSLYKQALDKGIAKEQARFLLPMSAPTTIYMKANIRDWIHYLTLRSDVNTTQREHANIAIDIIKNYFIPNFPSISEALGFTERFGNNINTTNDKNTSV